MTYGGTSTAPSVLITGTSTGIGRATTLYLARRGFRVFAGVRKNEDGASLRSDASTGQIDPVILDVTDAASIEAAVKTVSATLAGASLAGLVNNAGYTMTAPMEYVDIDELRQQFEVNTFGNAAVTRAFLPLLRRPGGRIVNLSSGAGKIVTPLIGPYCASKYALEAISDALRVELRGVGIHVSVVEPGFIDTPMHEKNEAQIARLLEALPTEARTRYEPAIGKLSAANERFSKTAAPAEEVATAVYSALTSARPRSRYPVTREAKLLAWIGPFLSDRMRDFIFGRIVGL